MLYKFLRHSNITSDIMFSLKYCLRNVVALWTLLFLPVTLFAQGFEPPSSVTNVVATAKDEAVGLTWDAATDEDGVVVRYKIYYGVSPVTEEGGTYDQEIDTQSDQTEYEVSDLINGDTYYFGITGVDDQGNESELYSVEVSGTPQADSIEGNGSPSLKTVTQSAPNKVLIVMSEPVRLDDKKEAFELTAEVNGILVPVFDSTINSEQVTLIVDPQDLTAGDRYVVTATTGVTDFDGNPVSSGILDSVVFVASDDFPEPEPLIIEEEPEEEEEVLIDEEPVLVVDEEPEPPKPDDFGTFFLDGDGDSDTSSFLDDLLAPEEELNNLVSEEPPEDGPTIATPVEPSVIPPANDNLGSAPDQIPPQDARNLTADTSNFASGTVAVNWTPAVDVDNDIKDQVLFTRVGLGQWNNGLSLGKNANQAAVEVQPNQNYQIRLVTIDTAGNESFGAAFEFSTTLSQSGNGQGTVVALAVVAAFSFFVLFVGGRRA